jgi:DNA-binding CsgD family transcriptional regulator
MNSSTHTPNVRRRTTQPEMDVALKWASLTPAEVRVACLVAEGNTNRDVAEALLVSPHTVSTHLRAVFMKLGVHSRVQLTRIVMEMA